MKNKRIVIFVCLLMMVTAFSAVATTSKQEKSSGNQNTGHRSGLFTQLPCDPGLAPEDWTGYPSASGSGWQAFENFSSVAGPIRSIHWWGGSVIWDGGWPCPNGDPVGMTFNITFYNQNNTDPTYPGDLVLSYTNVKPSITTTGIIYQDLENISLQLYFFEYDLTPSVNLSNGWVSILSTGSDNDCWFCWMCSPDDQSARYSLNGSWDTTWPYGLSLVLTDGEEPNLSIVDVTGGFGATLQLKNNGNATVDNFPVHFIIKGGMRQKIDITAGETVSGLVPDDTMSLKTGMFFGLGKITIFVVGDGIAAYKHGKQLLLYTIVQNT